MRPCSIPGTRTFWTYVYLPVTFGGMSTRPGPGATPTSLYCETGFVPGAPGERPGPGAGTNAGEGSTPAAARPWLEPEPGDATVCACDVDGGCVGVMLYCAGITRLNV